MNFDVELTLLSEEEIWGDKQLDVLKIYGTQSAITDLAVLTGAYYDDMRDHLLFDLKDRTGYCYTRCFDSYGNVSGVNRDGTRRFRYVYMRSGTVRPSLQSSVIFDSIFSNRMREYNGCEKVEYGEYPQYAPRVNVQKLLEQEFQHGNLLKTGRNYTFDSTNYIDKFQSFQPVTYDEYEYNGKKFIRIEARAGDRCRTYFKLSNGEQYKVGDNVWVEVSPVIWLIDEKTKTLICENGILAGIRFNTPDKEYNGDFKTTEMYTYLNKYMVKDLFQNVSLKNNKDNKDEQIKIEKRKNPYGLNFKQVSEEDIIKGAIESGVAVFLHGPSSEGKSARVKQIDPDSTIIYLRNATPDSLNGKSVYNSEKGEMIDVKPTWLKKLEAKCESEPDQLHIVFFDELTNALPSIQGIAFNIILDKEVNGIWKLPENARIVAAGNEMKDSLSANQLAEPLFNRFAHVYIKTTTENWLKWASEHHIHPAIYAYIAYKKGEPLRSKYDGEKPNADPRKWEMASKMLYQTKNPEMLRALIGEDITKEFVEFCNQEVITLDDVISGNYNEKYVQSLNTASRYATTTGLSQVDEENMEKVRSFIEKLGAEFVAIFDTLWTRDDESRLELIAEARLAERKRVLEKK